jgi:IS5 family transposase
MVIYRCLHPAKLFINPVCLKLTCYYNLIPPIRCSKLSTIIPWHVFDEAFSVHYTESIGAPSKPIRLMVELLILKQLENLSDESVVLQWQRNPYYQAFCGMQEFQRKLPCHSTELVHFRKRIGAEGIEY